MQSWQHRLHGAAAMAVLGLVFPGRLRPDRWREKRGFAAQIAIWTAVMFVLREAAARSRAQVEAARALARERAGREPTREEISAAHEELFLCPSPDE